MDTITFDDEPPPEPRDGWLLVRVFVPELNVHKCLQFPSDKIVWDVKQQCLASLPKVSPTLFPHQERGKKPVYDAYLISKFSGLSLSIAIHGLMVDLCSAMVIRCPHVCSSNRMAGGREGFLCMWIENANKHARMLRPREVRSQLAHTYHLPFLEQKQTVIPGRHCRPVWC
uniref:Uncharacterized protein n=1 Tax=Anopheles atroparvus TaxID=41427 RepID=A0AAG5D1C6_ANOAO